VTSLVISYSSHDQAIAARIRDRLVAEGVQLSFLDLDPEQGVPVGRRWEQELYGQLRKADAVIFLSSPASVTSQWTFAELAAARALSKPILPIIIESGPRHPLLADIQALDLTRDWEAGFGRLLSSLSAHGLDPHDPFTWELSRSPYPGLESFSEKDAAVFFGREEETRRLLYLLQPTLSLDGRGKVIAIIGPAGVGKTSLVNAGLLPRLARQPDRWLIVPTMAPANQPFRNLARSLAWAFEAKGVSKRPAELAKRLDGGAPAMVELLQELRGAGTGELQSILLVISQAEELATLTGAVERTSFLNMLGNTVHDAKGIWVVATVQAEFLRSLLEPGFAGLIDETLFLGSLDQSHLSEVIEKPADRAGLHFEPGLVSRLVQDSQGGDILSLLAYTLQQLSERAGPDGLITHQQYMELGGVASTLQIQANRVVEQLRAAGYGSQLWPALTKLVSLTPDGEVTRRRVPRSAFSMEEIEVVRAFVDHRLLTSSGDWDSPMVEVVHEALLRQWSPLRNAIAERREALLMRADLERWAQDWDRAGRQDDYLLVGSRLVAAQLWAADYPEQLAGVVRTFLEQSTPIQRLRIFLCHSSSDKPAVRRLYHELRAVNMQPWLDEKDILPGQDWDLEIRRAIRACDAIIVCLSERAITKRGYVQKEIKSALDIADEQPEGALFLIPLRLEPCEVPDRLRRWQWVDLFQKNGFEQLARALRSSAEMGS
jgi:hypothetical protein